MKRPRALSGIGVAGCVLALLHGSVAAADPAGEAAAQPAEQSTAIAAAGSHSPSVTVGLDKASLDDGGTILAPGKYYVAAVVDGGTRSQPASFENRIHFPTVYLGNAGASVNVLWPFLLALAVSIFGVMMGAGGGFILNPLLVTLWPLPHTVVAGTVMPTVLFSQASGIHGYSKIRFISWKVGIAIGLSTIAFNDLPDGAERRLDAELALLSADATGLPLLVEGAVARRRLAEEARCAGASFLALLGVLRAPRFEDLPDAEVKAGVASMEAALREMGWVFWVAEAPHYFITSSAPLRVAYPKAEEGWIEEMDLRSPGTEITCPLTPRVAIHATWKRSGELWRRAGEDALMELNGRTSLRAHQFLAAPEPAIPG